MDTSGDFDWLSNIISSHHHGSNILLVLDDSMKLQAFAANSYKAIGSMPASTIATISSSWSGWAEAMHSFIDEKQVGAVVSNLAMMTSGGFVVTVVKDTTNNIRLVPSLVRGKGAELYSRFIA